MFEDDGAVVGSQLLHQIGVGNAWVSYAPPESDSFLPVDDDPDEDAYDAFH